MHGEKVVYVFMSWEGVHFAVAELRIRFLTVNMDGGMLKGHERTFGSPSPLVPFFQVKLKESRAD